MQIAERSIASRSVPLAFSEYEQISSKAVGGWQAPSSEKLLSLNDQLPPPALDAQQFDEHSIRMPSLPASLVLSGSPSKITEPDTHFPASPALCRPRLSRRAMLIGIAGASMVLGGVGLWDLNSKGLFSTNPWTQVRPDAQGTTGTYPGQTPGTEAASPTNSAGSGNTASASSNKSTPSASSAVTSTPSTTSPTHTPTAAPDSASGTGSTPQATSTATPAIHISAQSMVAKGSTLSISVTTNMGSVAFQLIAAYSGLKNANKQVGPDQVGGTTNSSGNALVNWTPSLPSGQITRTTIASLRVEARDKNNNTLSSQVLTVSITR
jgi:hypothetical protein